MEKKKRYSTTNDRTEYSQKKINLPTEPKNDGATNLKLILEKKKMPRTDTNEILLETRDYTPLNLLFFWRILSSFHF